MTRAEILRDSVKIRLANDNMGSRIADVLRDNGVDINGISWDSVYPYWLIATHNDDVIGCCQVLPAQPVGYVEFLCVSPSASFKLRAIAMRKLIVQSMMTLRLAKCQYVGANIETGNFKFANILEKIDFVKSYQSDLFVKRLM